MGWLAGCNSLCACQLRRTGVTHLTILLETASARTVATVDPATEAPTAPKKRGWLPVLTVLFLISYGLMTMLIVEQGATIESQRALLRELYRDSEELSALRSKALQEKTVADSQSHTPTAKSKISVTPLPQASTTQTPSTQTPSTQTPSTQIPSTQIPSAQAPTSTSPSSQAAQQHRTKNQTQKQKPEFQMPTKPASDLIDDPRNLNVI
jgi:hypothetical protein